MTHTPNKKISPDQSRQTTATRLGTDDWGLERLVALGELDHTAPSDALDRLAQARAQRRAEAMADIAALDAPHLGLIR